MVPSRADIVALGDSNTWGAGVAAEDAWPRQLAAMTGKTVYSMALNGYGPVNSLAQWDEAVALNPRTVIEGLYAGNDLYDSFNLVYNQGQHPELKTSDPHVLEAVQRAEQSAPIAARVGRMFKMQEEEMGWGRRLLSDYSKIWVS